MNESTAEVVHIDVDRKLKGVRFRHDFLRRINTARRELNLTFQGLVQQFVRDGLEAHERKKRERAVDRTVSNEKRRANGLGIRERLLDPEPEVDLEEEVATALPPPPAQQTVTVRVEQVATGAFNLDEIAHDVVAGDRTGRKRRLEEACEKIRRHARSPQEILALGDRLDKAIEKIDGKPQSVLEKVRARRAK